MAALPSGNIRYHKITGTLGSAKLVPIGSPRPKSGHWLGSLLFAALAFQRPHAVGFIIVTNFAQDRLLPLD